MKHLKNIFTLAVILVFLNSCSHKYYTRNNYKYPSPVNTYDKKIKYQIKKIYKGGNVYIDNTFDGARMNGFNKLNDSTFRVSIEPENYPVNDSPWFSFKIWSDTIKKIYLKIDYIHGHHRYIPKISSDRINWKMIDTSKMEIAKNRQYVVFPLEINTNKLWVSAQEIINSSDVKLWINNLEMNSFVRDVRVIGKSKLGRDINYFRIGKGESKGKKVIILLSRQHPPEISGFLAMKSFIDELLVKSKLTEDFYDIYDIWVFPLLNPDGVDLGHWRHNANGVDLNRDWAYYRQPEIDQVTDYIVRNAKKNKNKVVFDVDFHSTQKDVYYVYNNSFKTDLHEVIKHWLDSIDRLIYPFQSVHSPEPLSKPYSKVWFYMQFKAESITYEVGDETPRDIIDKKARIAAVTLMDLLIGDD